MEYVHTREFRGAVFRQSDLTGAIFRECDLTGVRIAGSQVADLRITGFDGETGTVVVDDVDVTAYVAAELDRRHPERVQSRDVRTADDHRRMLDTVERLWTQTRERAERLPEAVRHERVDDEWSFAETLRHLVFAVDTWVGRMILGETASYHRLGLPPTDVAATEIEASYDEVVRLYADRGAKLRGVVEALTDDDLDQVRTGELIPEWGVESHSVAHCLRVVLREHVEHRRFAERDLARLAASGHAPAE
ncbi:DinB family protein [Herbidospora galbida]|uniref:DinB family protein n=1 Tax=Herbidospora galbida TaxID=2575442 RepID=A0A4U3MLT4_9ACTN|nr:DinB family protein [Herbidospora galbida]TKK90441.1 DinB family protein [Herbidospora galbida]